MPLDSSHCRSHCPINFVLETFGDRWTLLVVRDLMFKGKQSYGEFLRSDEGISTNILADRLKRLEADGIVSKTVAPDNKSKLLYSLTDKGKDLMPIMLEITAWSARHDARTNTPDEFLDQFRSDPDTVLRALRAKLENG